MSARILFVDDDAATREVFTAQLDSFGYEVTVAEEGTRALEVIRTHVFDVMLVDLRMPEIDGMEVLQDRKSVV